MPRKTNRSMRNKRKLKGLKKKLGAKKRLQINRTSVSLGQGFPKRLTFSHRYCETIAMTSSVGTMSTYQFVTNNLVKPNETETGHQPYYFDQLQALYNAYTVIGAKLTATILPQTEGEEGFRVVGYIEDDATVTGTGVNNLLEQSKAKLVYVAPNANTTKQLVLKWSAKKAFGGSILGNNDLQATSNGEPNVQQFFTLGIQGTGIQTTIAEIMVKIEYTAIWVEPKSIASS